MFNETQKEYLINYIIFKDYDIKIIDNNDYITLKKINKNILIDILYLLNSKINIIRDNIVNVNTTRTSDGGPFIRNYLKITKENGIEILKDASPVRLVYNPTHPDAMLSGINEGYVRFPNVDLITEYYDLIETIKLYNGIVDYIKFNYKQIAIEKINIMTIDEVEYNIRIEKLVELLLKFSLENSMKK
jgi:flagellar basal-body rod protein FlgC